MRVSATGRPRTCSPSTIGGTSVCFHLDLGQTARVLEIFDAGVRPGASGVALEMVDASAMLWRLRLRDIDAGDRWKGLADTWMPAADAYYAFNDAHAMMAFVGNGRSVEAQRLI